MIPTTKIIVNSMTIIYSQTFSNGSLNQLSSWTWTSQEKYLEASLGNCLHCLQIFTNGSLFGLTADGMEGMGPRNAV